MQDFSDLEQDLEETTAEDSRQGKDMQVRISTCGCTAPARKCLQANLTHQGYDTGDSLGQDAVFKGALQSMLRCALSDTVRTFISSELHSVLCICRIRD